MLAGGIATTDNGTNARARRDKSTSWLYAKMRKYNRVDLVGSVMMLGVEGFWAGACELRNVAAAVLVQADEITLKYEGVEDGQ